MRRLLSILMLGAAALAAPAMALTVSPAPNRDQASHLKQENSSGGGNVDLRDTLAGGGRAVEGDSYSTGTGYGQTQTYSFGSVTTTITTGRSSGFGSDYRPSSSFRPSFGSSSFGSSSFGSSAFRDVDGFPRLRH